MITLREPAISDADDLVLAMNNKAVTRYLSSRIPSPYTEQDATCWLSEGCAANAINKVIEFNGKFAGVIGVYTQQGEYAHSAELGYWVMPELWQKGVATSAINAFVTYLFTHTHISRIFNPVTQANRASIRVLEKNGFTLEGIMKNAVCVNGHYDDEHLYAKLKTKTKMNEEGTDG